MDWKNYPLEDKTSFYVADIPNYFLSVQYNLEYKNWHFSCYRKNTTTDFLIDTEIDPKNGYNTEDNAIHAAELWFKALI